MLEYPRNVLWYVEARKWGWPQSDPVHMGSAVAVALRSRTDPPRVRKLLLTCRHVIREDDAEGNAGCGPLLGEVLCWAPNNAYVPPRIQTDRVSGKAHRAFAARVFPLATLASSNTDSVPAEEQRPALDWALLDVQDPHFQDVEVVRGWADAADGDSLDILGYPNGADSFGETGVVECVKQEDFQPERLGRPGTMRLSGAASTAPGMSGGGVFNKKGELVGIHRSQTAAQLEFGAVRASAIREVLAANGWEVEEGPEGRDPVQAAIRRMETSVATGTYVEARALAEAIRAFPEAMSRIVERLVQITGADKELAAKGKSQPAEHVRRQILEVAAAQREAESSGVPADPESLHHLGVLAAYRRDHEAALDYFRRATQANPDLVKALHAIAWLQQGLGDEDRRLGRHDSAEARLKEAAAAARHTDPTNAGSLALRGYIAQARAHLARERGKLDEEQQHREEAARLFEAAAKLDEDDADAQNGLGNAMFAAGNLDGAIAAYRRAIKRAPHYAAAHHDLALAYEAKMKADPDQVAAWRKRAISAWQKAYELMPGNPAFASDYVTAVGRRIARMKRDQHK